jgi:beta-RFAP synthase
MKAVRVEAPARLHWGLFDLNGSLGRRFGGLGVAITGPAVVVEASISDDLTAAGADCDRALAFARRYLEAAGIHSGARLCIEKAIPGHVGLGSGTKLGLAVARALAALYDQPDEPLQLARAVGRGKRSAVGLWTFAGGGFVVEGGRRLDKTVPAPLLLRQAMPADWHCLLVIPDQPAGLSGRAEAAAFKRLSQDNNQAARIAHLVLMSLLPALVERDLAEFGPALSQIQQLIGPYFSPVQGGTYSNPLSTALIEALLTWGAAGAGQSSWGPAVYGLVESRSQGDRLVELVDQMLDGRGSAMLVAFDNQGARIQNA